MICSECCSSTSKIIYNYKKLHSFVVLLKLLFQSTFSATPCEKQVRYRRSGVLFTIWLFYIGRQLALYDY